MNGYRDEQFNIRCFYLRMRRRLWLLPLAALLGAALGFCVYFLAAVVYGPARSYRAEAKLYLTFARDPSGEVYDYYNDYTWNKLMETDDILDETMRGLAAAGIPEISGERTVPEEEPRGFKTGQSGGGSMDGVSRADVIESTNARTPSDVRLMILQITNHDRALAQAICRASAEALVRFGQTHAEFERIEIRELGDAAVVVRPDRTQAAVIAGALFGLFAAAAGMLLYAVTDSAVYVPEDLERRYRLHVLGMLPVKGQTLPKALQRELASACSALVRAHAKEAGGISLAAGDTLEEAEARRLAEAAQEALRELSVEGLRAEAPADTAPDGAVLLVRAGRRYGTRTEHVISRAALYKRKLYGAILTEVDTDFIAKYYRISQGTDDKKA